MCEFEVNGSHVGDSLKKSDEEDNRELLEALEDLSIDEEEHKCCRMCKNKYIRPTVLNCLHVYCLKCLEESLKLDQLECPACKQVTVLDGKQITDLPEDHVTSNVLAVDEVADEMIECQSCSGKQEKAVARCADCSAFLCANCDQAHRYMNLFKHHKVIKFETVVSGEESIHKPINCSQHNSEPLKLYCQVCQETICGECVIEAHRQHSVCKVENADSVVEELKIKVDNLKSHSQNCDDLQENMDSVLQELQLKRDVAKGLIDETYHSFKAALEKRRDELYSELEKQHAAQRNRIMEDFSTVDKTLGKIQDLLQYWERLSTKGNRLEVSQL